MRTVLPRQLTTHTNTIIHHILRSSFTSSSHLRLSSQPHLLPSRPRAPYSTNSSSTWKQWPLQDLRAVSQKTSPLIFHLTSDDPYLNLSLEHYILVNSDPSSRILLFYTNRPCVVVGRNQNPWLETDLGRLKAGDSQQPSSSSSQSRPSTNDKAPTTTIDLVRRRSGGGTVFHDDGNLNYSVIVPNTTKYFTRALHAEMVVRALSPFRSRFGFSSLKVNDRNDIVMLSAAGNADPSHAQAQPWLKVSGSAYKLTKGRALHHGTLLFSSPNLHNISSFLRSPGRDHIEAKGVESVRSKVGNLAWTPDVEKRAQIRQLITDAIVAEFRSMYDHDADEENQIEKGDQYTREISLSEADCTEQANPEVAAGVAELRTPEWTFDQTPRFDFASPIVDGVQIRFHADRGGTIHSISLYQHHGADGTIRAPDGGRHDHSDDGNDDDNSRMRKVVSLTKDELRQRLQSSSAKEEIHANSPHQDQDQDEIRLRAVADWSALLSAAFAGSGVVVPDELVRFLHTVFPDMSVTSSGTPSGTPSGTSLGVRR